MSNTILITGACGFIGKALANRFADLGYTVIAADVAGHAWRDDVRLQQLDICDAASVADACKEVDTIIHNASLVHTKQNCIEDVWAVNHQGTLNVINACRQHEVAKLIYISSASAVYEGRDIENGDETLPYGKDQAPYADSKIQAEKDVLAFSGTASTTCCAIRPHVVFGAGDNRFIPAILEKAEQGRLRRINGSNDKLSDFTYIDNLVDAVVAAETQLAPDAAAAGQAYFITNGEPMPFFDFVEKFLMELGYPPINRSVPLWLAYSAAAVAEGIDTLRGGTMGAEGGLSRFAVKYMVTHHYFNIAKARRDLGWAPQVTLEDGIRRTIAALGLQRKDRAA